MVKYKNININLENIKITSNKTWRSMLEEWRYRNV